MLYLSRVVLLLLLYSCLSQASAQNLSAEIALLEKGKKELAEKQAQATEKLELLRLQKIRDDLRQIGLPSLPAGSQLVEHSAMTLSYNESHEQPDWVAHIVVPQVREGNLTRTNDFREDPKVTTGTAVKDDYWYSGYDRGHIAPSADFRWSASAISESYYYSNMSPQRPELNRERWAELEDWVRRVVLTSDKQLIIIAGPILRKGLPQITQGPNKVSIPEFYFKVILDLESEEKKAIGYIMPNKLCPYPVISYAVTIDSIERLSGLQFLTELDPQLQKKLKNMADPSKWETEGEDDIVDVPPMTTKELPKNTVNTVDAAYFLDQKVSVCGTVVSTKKTKSGAVFINLDTKFPRQIFSISIWEKDCKNFSYAPEIELLGKKICVTGIPKDYKGTPSMNISNEKKIKFLDDEE